MDPDNEMKIYHRKTRYGKTHSKKRNCQVKVKIQTWSNGRHKLYKPLTSSSNLSGLHSQEIQVLQCN